MLNRNCEIRYLAIIILKDTAYLYAPLCLI